MACEGIIGPAVAVSSGSNDCATGAGVAGAGGMTVSLGAGEDGAVTEIGGASAAGALGGTEILGAEQYEVARLAVVLEQRERAAVLWRQRQLEALRQYGPNAFWS